MKALCLSLLLTGCATTRNTITPTTQIEIASLPVAYHGAAYHVYLFNFVSTGSMWVLWTDPVTEELEFMPVHRIDFDLKYYEPYTMRGGHKDGSAKDLVAELFLKSYSIKFKKINLQVP